MTTYQQAAYNRGYKQGHLEGQLAAEYCQPSRPVPVRRETLDYQRGFHAGYQAGYESNLLR